MQTCIIVRTRQTARYRRCVPHLVPNEAREESDHIEKGGNHGLEEMDRRALGYSPNCELRPPRAGRKTAPKRRPNPALAPQRPLWRVTSSMSPER
jgi:hypothetical protein